MEKNLDTWRKHYGEFPPYSHFLRTLENGKWVRFHGLPETKRYAETEAEFREILRRANMLGNDILGFDQSCLIVVYYLFLEEVPSDFSTRFIQEHDLFFMQEWEDPESQPECKEIFLFYVGSVSWTDGLHNRILTEAAKDQAHFLLMNKATGRIFAPYDGGFDCFLLNQDETNNLRAKYSDWLSPHFSGL